MTSKWNLLALGLILYAAPGHAVNTSAADTAGSSSRPPRSTWPISAANTSRTLWESTSVSRG